jgi:hypothetical protein
LNKSRLCFDKAFNLLLKPNADWYVSDGKQHLYITKKEIIKEDDWVTNGANVFKPSEVPSYTLEYANKYWEKIVLTTDQCLIDDDVQAIDDSLLEWFVKNPSCESLEVERLEDGKFVDRFEDGSIVEGIYENYKIILPIRKIDSCRHFDIEVGCDKAVCVCENEGYVCPETNSKCDDECCVSAERCQIKASKDVIFQDKQETLEEAAKEFANNSASCDYEEGINVGKYQGFIDGAKWQSTQEKNKYSDEDIKPLLSFLREIKTNWDCDNDAHKYNTICRCCDAENILNQWFQKFQNKQQ